MKHQHLETTPEVSRRMAKVHLKHGEAECILAKDFGHWDTVIV